MKEKNLKLIVVSRDNYLELKKRGFAGDSFNDVISKLLEQNKVRPVELVPSDNR